MSLERQLTPFTQTSLTAASLNAEVLQAADNVLNLILAVQMVCWCHRRYVHVRRGHLPVGNQGQHEQRGTHTLARNREAGAPDAAMQGQPCEQGRQPEVTFSSMTCFRVDSASTSASFSVISFLCRATIVTLNVMRKLHLMQPILLLPQRNYVQVLPSAACMPAQQFRADAASNRQPRLYPSCRAVCAPSEPDPIAKAPYFVNVPDGSVWNLQRKHAHGYYARPRRCWPDRLQQPHLLASRDMGASRLIEVVA